MPLDFVATLFFVFIVSALIMILGTKTASFSAEESAFMSKMKESFEPGDIEELAELISRDSNILKPAPPVEIPHVQLPGAKLGGGAADESCSKAAATIDIYLNEDPSERRKYNRRLQDRRISDQPIQDERRLIQRRIWLRREEDRKGKVLLNVTDAAQTLGVPIEQIYKWLDKSDIPFYQVTEGKRRAIRFEINELLQWHSALGHRQTDKERKP